MKFIYAIIVLLFALTGCCLLPNQTPRKGGSIDNPFGCGYYECTKCGSLDGGIYAKGGISSWRSEGGTYCYHNWIKISPEEFDKKWKEKTGKNQHY